MFSQTKQAYLEPVFDLFPVDEEIDWSCLAACVLEVLVPRKLFLFATRSRHRRLQSQVVPLAEARREDERGRLKDKKEIYFYYYLKTNYSKSEWTRISWDRPGDSRTSRIRWHRFRNRRCVPWCSRNEAPWKKKSIDFILHGPVRLVRATSALEILALVAGFYGTWFLRDRVFIIHNNRPTFHNIIRDVLIKSNYDFVIILLVCF